MRVAVLGTGIMGSAMARNVAAAGHDVVAGNRTLPDAAAHRVARAVELGHGSEDMAATWYANRPAR